MKLNYKRTILVGMAFFLISAFWQAYDAIIPLILTNHFGLPQSVSGAVMSIDNVLAVFMLPIFGAISDKVCTKMGKRTPFILIGTIAAVCSFMFLIFVDTWQLNALIEAGIKDRYADAQALLASAQNAFEQAKAAGGIDLAPLQAEIDAINASIAAIRTDVLNISLKNTGVLVAFIVTLLVMLVSMATFRSPAVALMPDVTVKPLRSKANAIINLTGTAGAMIILGLGIVFATSKNHYMSYIGYVGAVVAVMLFGLVVFLATVKEKKWAAQMQEEAVSLGIEDAPQKQSEIDGHRKLQKSELISLLLILASVALWYIGYNSITSKYSVYATNILGFDFNLTLIIAQAAAIVSYIPVGLIASKIGRKKTILAGIVMLASAFLIGNFIEPTTPEFVMYPVFILAGMGWATINVNSFPMVVELAIAGDVGKYTGYYYTASMAAQIVAPILSGILYDAVGMRAMFFSFGTVFVALSFVTMLFVKHGDAKSIKKRSALENLDVED